MALPASGQISLLQIGTEFSDISPHSISEFAGEVGKTATAGQNVAFSDFHGLSAGTIFEFIAGQNAKADQRGYSNLGGPPPEYGSIITGGTFGIYDVFAFFDGDSFEQFTLLKDGQPVPVDTYWANIHVAELGITINQVADVFQTDDLGNGKSWKFTKSGFVLVNGNTYTLTIS